MAMFMTKRQADRLAEKLSRMAFELDYDATRLLSWKPSYADDVKLLARQMQSVAQRIGAEIT